jgi:type I restriction enzyme M protein
LLCKQSANNPNTIEYKIGEIFSELRNKLQSGYALREVVNKADELKFLSNEDKHELSSLYEEPENTLLPNTLNMSN